MRYSTHKMLTWLLMLALTFGPAQSVIAMDMSQMTDGSCLQMPADALSANADLQSAPCSQPDAPPCPNMDGCTGFSSVNLLAFDPSALLARAPVLRVRLPDGDARLSTRYPDLLQRPPQA